MEKRPERALLLMLIGATAIFVSEHRHALAGRDGASVASNCDENTQPNFRQASFVSGYIPSSRCLQRGADA